ncbi:MAG: MoxR family ATPase [Alkalibacterium sp.]|nr:MoxR family ATPase [Alkalibacterium sp.]
MLAAPDQQKEVQKLTPVMSIEEFLTLKDTVEHIHVEEALLKYIVSLALLTRNHPAVRLGISPRGNQFALASARAHALLAGRDYVIPQDILDILKPLYRHRLLFENHLSLEETDSFIDQLTQELMIPTQTRFRR